ncbi:MAG: outer membrane protein transport protein [Mariprofundaceae bacterium]
MLKPSILLRVMQSAGLLVLKQFAPAALQNDTPWSTLLSLIWEIKGGKKMRKVLILFSALFVWGQAAQAGGFMVGEMATRSAGMASAFTAVADDASAAWHNPAGVAFTDGAQAMLGGDLILTKNSYTSNTSTVGVAGPVTNTANGKNGAFVVPHAYFTYWDENSRLGASLSINSPFGLETEWPSTAAFSSKNTFSRINMLMVNPSVIFKLSDSLSIAGGVVYGNIFNVDLDNTVQKLHGTGDGWGGNASIFYKGDGFNFGVTYRSRIKVDIDGAATAQGAFAALTGATTSSATTSVTLPDQVNVGLAVMPSEQWLLSLDVDWVNWKTYDAINIKYNSALYRAQLSGLQAFLGGPGAATGQTDLPQNWKATVAIRVGAEWKYNDQMRARFGYIFDPTPIEDADFSPSVPGNDRHLFSVGYGYDLNPNTTIDLAYAYVYIVERDQTASPVGAAVLSPNTVKNGTYNGDAHIFMASVNYAF